MDRGKWFPASQGTRSILQCELGPDYMVLVKWRPLQTPTFTHTHPFNGLLSGTIWVSRYQKGKTFFTGRMPWRQIQTNVISLQIPTTKVDKLHIKMATKNTWAYDTVWRANESPNSPLKHLWQHHVCHLSSQTITLYTKLQANRRYTFSH